ncbi:hypothetical protein WJX72_005094 [[Myrmecia] bisecta]|uniref:Uncharacterized protein n=1 Tax=[Myrmecia] bisecta TaxID=41462 RepID=A0AAW1Q8V0_9CHLO
MAVTKPSGPTREAHTAAHALLQGLTETWPGDELLPAKCRSLLPRLCRMVALRAATLEAASPAEKQGASDMPVSILLLLHWKGTTPPGSRCVSHLEVMDKMRVALFKVPSPAEKQVYDLSQHGRVAPSFDLWEDTSQPSKPGGSIRSRAAPARLSDSFSQAAQHALRQAGLDELQHDMVQCIFLRETSGDAQDGQPRSLTSSPVKSLLERSKPSEREYAVQRQAGESAAASLRNTLGRFSVRSTSPAGAPMSDCCKAATDTEDCATTSNGRQPRQDAQPGVSGQWAQDMAARSYSQAAAGSVGAVSASGPHSPPVHESDAQPNPQEDPRRQQENCTVGQMLGDSWNVIASLADEGSFTMPDLAPRRHASFSVKAAGREALRSLRVSADNLFGRHVTIRGHLTRPRQGLAGTSGDDFATHWSKRQPEDRLTEFENSPLHLGLINPYR